MGLLTSFLAAIGCAPASAKRPVLADYEVSLHRRRVLQLDPAVATTGRFEIVPGDGLVLELTARRGRGAITRDTVSYWAVAIELPTPADPSRPLELTLDGAPTIARVAGEDVLYLARGGKGKLTLARTAEPVTGEIDVVFEAPDRDLLKLGSYQLSGTFQARLK